MQRAERRFACAVISDAIKPSQTRETIPEPTPDHVLLVARTLAISLPYSSLERDFCRRRLARQKGPEDDVSAQRPEMETTTVREMAAKTAFLLTSCQLRVSEDWVVADAVDRNRSLGTGNFSEISGQNRLLGALMAAASRISTAIPISYISARALSCYSAKQVI